MEGLAMDRNRHGFQGGLARIRGPPFVVPARLRGGE